MITIRESTVLTDQTVMATDLGLEYYTDLIKVDSNMFSGCEVSIQEYKNMPVWYTGNFAVGDTPDDMKEIQDKVTRTSSSFYLRLSCRPTTYNTTYIVSCNIRAITGTNVPPINITWMINVGPDPRDQVGQPPQTIPFFAFPPTTSTPGVEVTSDVITLTGLPNNTTYTVSSPSGGKINLGITSPNPSNSNSATVTTGSAGSGQIMFSVTHTVLSDDTAYYVWVNVSDGTHHRDASWVINTFTYSASDGLIFTDVTNVWAGTKDIISNIVHVPGLPRNAAVSVGIIGGTVAASNVNVSSFKDSDFFSLWQVTTSNTGDLYVQARTDANSIGGDRTVIVYINDSYATGGTFAPSRYIYWEIKSTISQVYDTTKPTTITTSKVLDKLPPTWCVTDGFGDPWADGFGAVGNPADGKLYVFGGTTWENDCYRYDFIAHKWEYAGQMQNRRRHFVFGAKSNGDIYVVGGFALSFLENANTVESINGPSIVYNYGTDSTNTQQVATVKWGQVSRSIPFRFTIPPYLGTIYGDACYILPNNEAQLYAISLITANEIVMPRYVHAKVFRSNGALAGYNNRIYAIGGFFYNEFTSTTIVHNSVEFYELADDTWNEAPPLNTARYGFSTITANNIYVFGGIGSDGKTLDSIEMFDGFKWTILPQKMPKAYANFVAANVGTTVYFLYSDSFNINSVVIPSIGEATGLALPNQTPTTIIPVSFTIDPKIGVPTDTDVVSDVEIVNIAAGLPVDVSVVDGDNSFIKIGSTVNDLTNAPWVKSGLVTASIYMTFALQIKTKSSKDANGTVVTTIKVGSYSTTWNVITAGSTTTMVAGVQVTDFKFTDVIGVKPDEFVFSEIITIIGLPTGTQINVSSTRGEIAIGDTIPSTTFSSQQSLITSGSFVMKAKLMAGGLSQTEYMNIVIDVDGDQYTARWSVTSLLEELPPMSVARTGHQLISNFNNLLYVFGGHNGHEQGVEPIEAYDPETKTWSTVGNMKIPRWNFGAAPGATRDETKGIFSIGGYKEKNVMADYYEIFYDGYTGYYDTDPVTGIDVKVNTNGQIIRLIRYGVNYINGLGITIPYSSSNTAIDLPTQLDKCSGFSFTSFHGDDVLIGGINERDQVLGLIYRRFGALNNWEVVSSLKTPRTNHSVLKFNGRLYIIGGINQNGDIVSSVEIFDGTTSIHVAVVDPSLLTGVIVNIGHKVYVSTPNDPVIKVFSLWGMDGEINKKSVGTATTPAPLNYPRYNFGCVKDRAGNIYVVGGRLSFYETISTIEKYNATTNTWTVLPPFIYARSAPTVVIDNNDKIYVIGGTNTNYITSGHITKIEIYDPTTNRWQFFQQDLHAITGLTTSYITYRKKTNELFLIGNDSYSNAYIFIYNLTTGVFTTEYTSTSPFPIGASVIIENSETQASGSLFILGGILVGSDGLGYAYRYARAYNFYSHKLEDLKPLTISRTSPAVLDYDGIIYLFGGATSSLLTTEQAGGTGEYWLKDGAKSKWVQFYGHPLGNRYSSNVIYDSKKNIYLFNDGDLNRKIGKTSSGEDIYSDGIIEVSSTAGWGTIYLTTPRSETNVIEGPDEYMYVIGGVQFLLNNVRTSTFTGQHINYSPTTAVERFKIGSNVIQSSTTITNTNTGTTQPANVVIPVPPPLNTARYDFGFAQVSNNLIYVIGGKDVSNNELASVERYDLSKNTWTTVAPLSKSRSGGKAVVDKNNNIYIIGGTTTGSTSTTINYVLEVERFSNNKWETITQLPRPRNNHEVQINLTTNEIYVFGGTYNYTDKYSIDTNTWEQLPFARDNSAGSTIDSDGNMYYFSSETGTSDNSISFFKFNVVTDKWELQDKNDSLPYSKFTSVIIKTNKVFAIGGLSKTTSISASAKWFDSSAKQWVNAPDLPSGARSFHSSVVDSNNKIFVIGGGTHRQSTIGNYSNKLTDTVDVLDSTALTWATVTKLNNPRFGAQSVIFNDNTIFNFGGWTANGKASDIVERYDPASNRWYTSTAFSITIVDDITGNTASNVTTTTGNVTYPIPDLTIPTTIVNPNITSTTTTPDKQTTPNTAVVVTTTGYPTGTTVTLPSTITNVYSDVTITSVPVIVDQSATWGTYQSTSLTNTVDMKIKAFYGLSEFTALNLK